MKCMGFRSYIKSINSLKIIIILTIIAMLTGCSFQNSVFSAYIQFDRENMQHIFGGLFISFSLFILAVQQLIIYYTIKKEKFALYSSLISFSVSLHSLFTISEYTSGLPTSIYSEMFIKLSNLCIILSIMLIFMIFYIISWKKKNKKVMNLIIIISSIYSICISMVSDKIYYNYLKILHLTVAFIIAYLIFILLFNIARNKEKLQLLHIGFILLPFLVLNDLLYYYSLIETGYFTFLELLIFIAAVYITINKQCCNKISTSVCAEDERKIFADSLLEYSSNLTTNINLNEMLKIFLQKLKNIVPFNSGMVVLKDGESFKVAASIGNLISDITGSLINNPFESQLINEVIESRLPFVIKNLDKQLPESYLFMNNKEEKSLLAVPIFKKDEILGILIIRDKTLNSYNKYYGEKVFSFASQFGVAIGNAMLFNEIKKLAIEDELTKISNRRFFFQLAEREFKHHKRYKEFKTLSIAMIDIDNFKNINDTYGHFAGDKVLKMLAKICKDSLRETDLIGRYGGEEFAILLPHTDAEEALLVAERIRKSIDELKIPCDGDMINITVSIGLTTLDEKIQSLNELMIKADKALYLSKGRGKNCITIL